MLAGVFYLNKEEVYLYYNIVDFSYDPEADTYFYEDIEVPEAGFWEIDRKTGEYQEKTDNDYDLDKYLYVYANDDYESVQLVVAGINIGFLMNKMINRKIIGLN